MTKVEMEHFVNSIDEIFPIDKLLKLNSDNNDVVDYYSKTNIFYRKMHSEQGAIHFPVSSEGVKSHAEKLLFQAKTVGEYIERVGAKRVLELGCGMGFNSTYLAKKYPDCQFEALDLTPKNIGLAKKKSEGLSNVSFQIGDFDDLKLNGKYDVIFAVETLCHSKDLLKVLSDSSQHLSPKGKIIIFDGYGTPKAERETEQDDFLKTVAELFAKGFVISAPQRLSLYDDITSHTGLNVEELKDYSENILSNFKKFQEGSMLLIKYPLLTKILLQLKVIPFSLFLHAIAGISGPYLLENKYTCYTKVVLSKS